METVTGSPPAPALGLTDLDGRMQRLEDYRGRTVVVTFWATWCAPCRRELPTMQRAWEALRERGVSFLAVNLGDRPADVCAATEEMELGFPVLLDPELTAGAGWDVRAVPVSFVVDRDGHLVYRVLGTRDWSSAAMLKAVAAAAGAG